MRDAIQEISEVATVLRPRPTLHILKDEPDNRILERAIAAEAEYVISGDRHLLALKHHAGITMLSLADFVAQLHKEKSRGLASRSEDCPNAASRLNKHPDNHLEGSSRGV